jgi:hypothetical protein
MPRVSSQTVEFHRFGSSEMLLKPENRYIRTTGWDSLAEEVSPGLGHREFQRSLNALRYWAVAGDGDRLAALSQLSAEAARFLTPVRPEDGQLVQVDLITNAAELWAFPFEACFAGQTAWLAESDRGVIITRRIRGAFSEKTTAWPSVPSVLFLHAPVAADLEQSLIDAHTAALTEALTPWMTGKPSADAKLLRVREVTSVDDIVRFRAEFKPAYVHLLAHGAPTFGDPWLPEEKIWGLRLGGDKQPGSDPVDVADALRPHEDLPLVVTVAACDSANQASPIFAAHSVVQDLHRCGVPVVIGSQLPLTKPGSHQLTEAFYARLLRGDDVRVALHAARVALKGDDTAGHDWLSLVGYVRLPPEGYAAYLDEVGLRMELRMLDAAQERADGLAATNGSLADFAAIERQVRERLESLARRRGGLMSRQDLLEECNGLEASAYKRLAELLFVRGRSHEALRAVDWQASREFLGRALTAYRAAFDADLRSHWLGVQQLALDAVLTGAISRPDDWFLVTRAAEVVRDRSGKEDYWSCGSLAELALIAPLAGRPRDLERAKAAASLLVERARRAREESAIASTRRQVDRYVGWWVKDHGFFPGARDLADDARTVLQVLV